MLKFNANIVGIGDSGVSAVNEICRSGVTGFKTITLSSSDKARFSRADHVLVSKIEFVDNCGKYFLSPNTAVFVLTDVSSELEVSLACEIASITLRNGALPVCVAFMPSSRDECFEEALESLGELRDVFSGIVRFNEGYVDSFYRECARFFTTLSCSMSLNATFPVKNFEEMKDVFSKKSDIYFASVVTKEKYDSHLYNSKCMCLKLCAHMTLDEAESISYFYASAGDISQAVLDFYRGPIEKINLGYLSNRTTYISENALELKEDEHLFSVICCEKG